MILALVFLYDIDKDGLSAQAGNLAFWAKYTNGGDFMVKSSSDFERTDMKRHWSPKSEKFAGGDALASMMNAGWQIKSLLSQEQRRLSGTRQITIYHLELERDGRIMNMSALCNPYVNRLLASAKLRVEASAANH